jgi:nitronate monooxygenase
MSHANQDAVRLPVIGAPMFIVSNPELVIAQCSNGIIGAFPALNARPQSVLEEWLTRIETALARHDRDHPERPSAPYAVNHIIHDTNERVPGDLAVCARHKVPLIITSLRAPGRLVEQVHAWGGQVFHDVTNLRHARKALAAGVDGLILVCAGAGGHAGGLSPFALVNEVRQIFDGPIALSGAIMHGKDVLAAQVMGADYAYMGTRFIASTEANASPAYKRMLLDAQAADVQLTPYFSGIPANYLRASIVAAGLDPDALPPVEATQADFGSSRKAWRDIWGAGQGVGSITAVQPAAEIIAQLRSEYEDALRALPTTHAQGARP